MSHRDSKIPIVSVVVTVDGISTVDLKFWVIWKHTSKVKNFGGERDYFGVEKKGQPQ